MGGLADPQQVFETIGAPAEPDESRPLLDFRMCREEAGEKHRRDDAAGLGEIGIGRGIGMKYIGTVETFCVSHNVCVDSIPFNVLGVEVYRNARLRVAFGKAKREHRNGVTLRWWIELNPKLWNDLNELIDTFTHEVAHVIVGDQGDYGHGLHWRRAHLALGGTGKQFGSKVSAAALGIERARKLIGICQKCDKQFYGPQRLRKGRRYIHRIGGCRGLVIKVDL